MKKGFILVFAFFLLSRSVCQAQYDDKKVVMTIAGRDVEAGEFLRMYNKSADTSGKEDIDKFLDQFIGFKLKVAEAVEEGYDTLQDFHTELKGYRDQLAQSYLSDQNFKQTLLNKARERYEWEVNASHILVECRQDASPEDTLKAYGKALDIREKIINGDDFEKTALAESSDRSVATNRGNLGYFTVFQMITPFEDAAFTLSPGTLSMPVRTSYGYHIIRVNDKRQANGKIRVAHIMKAVPAGSDVNKLTDAESEINEIYTLLLKGESFSRLARERSDHKETAVKGGEMAWFGPGEIIPDFAGPAFSIRDTGTFTRPVRTVYGFHIIKLLEKKPPEPWDEVKPVFEARLNQSNISNQGKRSFISALKKEYDFKVDQSVRNWFVTNTDSLVMKGKTGYNRNKLPEGSIFSFAGRSYPAGGFASYLENRAKRALYEDPARFIDLSIDLLSSDEILKYEDSVLEDKYPDFRYLIEEFHDGILLFNISSDKIWNRIQDDSLAIKKYYLDNSGKFLSERTIEGKIYVLHDVNGAKRLASAFRKYKNKFNTDSLLLSKFTSDGDTLIRIFTGKWQKGDNSEIDRLSWTPGLHELHMNGFPAIIRIDKVVEPEILPFDTVQADVISGYQDWLTQKWVEDLKKKYIIEIHGAVFEEIKKTIENE